jgi:tetratricopeptide (TPR) repeat protein
VAHDDQQFLETVHKFTEYAANQKALEPSLHKFDKDVYIQNLKEQLLQFRHDIQDGYNAVIESAFELEKKQEPSEVERTKARVVKHTLETKRALKRLSDTEFPSDWLEKGVPLFKEIGLSPEAVTTLYEAAHYLLEKNRDDEARKAFRFLLLLAPHIAELWFGLGLALLKLSQGEEAVQALEQALTLDKKSVQIFLYFIRALVEAGRRNEADAKISFQLDQAAQQGDKERYELLSIARNELQRFVSKRK